MTISWLRILSLVGPLGLGASTSAQTPVPPREPQPFDVTGFDDADDATQAEGPERLSPPTPGEAAALGLRGPSGVPAAPTPLGSAQAAPGEAPDDGYSPLALGYMASSVGLAAAGISVELCTLAECEGPRPWTGAALVLTVGGTAVAGRMGRQRRVHVATATLIGLTPRNATLLGWEVIAAARFRRSHDDWGTDTDLAIGRDALVGGLLGAQILGYGAAVVVDRTLHPTTGEVMGADAGGLLLTSATVMALYSLPDDPNWHPGRLHAGLLASTTGGLVLGGMMARRGHMGPGRVLALEGAAILGGGLGALGAWFVGGDDTTFRSIGITTLLSSGGAAAVVGYVSRDWAQALPRSTRAPRVTAQMDLQPTAGGAMLGASGRF